MINYAALGSLLWENDELGATSRAKDGARHGSRQAFDHGPGQRPGPSGRNPVVKPADLRPQVVGGRAPESLESPGRPKVGRNWPGMIRLGSPGRKSKSPSRPGPSGRVL